METVQKKTPRAKKLICDAFLSLIEEKGFYAIKVVDIIERADISRTTFYFHYEDKYALISELRSEMLDGFISVMTNIRRLGMESIRRYDVSLESPYRQYFAYIRDNERIWRLFLSGKGESDFSQRFSDRIRQHIELTYHAEKRANAEKDPCVTDEMAANIGAWTTVGLISRWVLNGMTETPEEMGKVLSVFWKRFCTW